MEFPARIPVERKENIARIFKDDGRTVMLAIDHGYFQGPITGLENPEELVIGLGRFCDAISPTKGVLEYCIAKIWKIPIVLRASGGNSLAEKPGVDYIGWLNKLEESGKILDYTVKSGRSTTVKAGPTTDGKGKVISEERELNLQSETIKVKEYWPFMKDLAALLSIPRGRDLSNEVLTCTAEEAKRLGAVGVSVSIYVGAEHETQTIKNLADMATQAHMPGIDLAVLGITAVGENLGELREPGKESEFARYLALASRIAFELGADMVKTYYVPGGFFEKVVNGCPVPIVIAGGKKVKEFEALQTTYNAIKEGASGVDWGRNVFQSKYPDRMLLALNAIVHDNKTPEEASELYELPRE